jgi:hypothetical protein
MAVASASAWLSSWGAPDKRETDWSNELAEAQHLLRDVAIDLQDREAKFRRGADAARLTAGIRRRVLVSFGVPSAALWAGRRRAAAAAAATPLCAHARVAATRRLASAARLVSRRPPSAERKSTRCELVSC